MQRCLSLIAGIGCVIWNVHAQTPDWIGPFGGNGEDVVRKLHVTADGHTLTTGYFTDQSDMGLGSTTHELSSNGFYDAFVQKNAPDGHTLWAVGFGSGMGFEYGTAVTTDPSGNVYATGIFEEPVDFDPGAGEAILTPVGELDIYLVKLTATGDFVWAKSIAGTEYEEATGIGCDENGNVYLSGYFHGTTDFDHGEGSYSLVSAGLGDNFIAKYAPNGSLQWVYSVGNSDNDLSLNLKVMPNGTVYNVGSFSGSVDFDPGSDTYELTTVSNSLAGYYLVMDTEGNFVNAGHFASAGSVVNYDIAVDEDQNVYITGHFNGATDFDPGPGTVNRNSETYQGFVVKLQSDGALEWIYMPESAEAVIGYSVDVSASGNVTMSGYIENETDFNPEGVPFLLMTTQPQNAALCFYVTLEAETGSFIHAAAFGGANFMDYHAAYTDESGALYVSGTFETQSDLNPDANAEQLYTSSGFRDSYVIRIPPAGSGVGLNENELPALSVYPNPFTTSIQLASFSDQPVYGFLTDASGRRLKSWNGVHTKSIDLSDLSAGYYQLHLAGYNTLILFKQ